MKFDAHPLVVAAAMGLLGPAALASDADPMPDDDDDALVEAAVEAPPAAWVPMEAPPDASELHRVEIEWLKYQDR